MIGRIRAADDEAISTAYRAACPVSNARASAIPKIVETTPTVAARTRPCGRALRSATSRIGTCEPAMNMTSANPMSARNVKVGSSVSR